MRLRFSAERRDHRVLEMAFFVGWSTGAENELGAFTTAEKHILSATMSADQYPVGVPDEVTKPTPENGSCQQENDQPNS